MDCGVLKMSLKYKNVSKLKTILTNIASSVNKIGGDSKQIDFKLNDTIVSIYETGSVVYRGKTSNCNIQTIINKKIEAINELETPIVCESTTKLKLNKT